MAKAVVMPKLGTTMKEGVLTEWHKALGEYIQSGEILLTVESNKANVEVEAVASGYLVKKLYEAGDTLPIGITIGYIAENPDEVISEAPAGETAAVAEEPATAETKPLGVKPAAGAVAATPKARTLAKKLGVDIAQVMGTGKNGIVTDEDVQKFASPPKATPLARVIAGQNHIDLAGVSGSGANGKIRRDDLEPVMAAAADGKAEERVPFAGMRRVIADNMYKSKHTMAHAYHRLSADMTAAKAVRQGLAADGVKISYNDLLVKAVAMALMEHPKMNVSVDGDELVYHRTANIGLAVALEEGLIVPNIKNAQDLSLRKISEQSAALVEKAREGGLSRAEYTGGTFTISNLGMYDIEEFIAIINPPEAGIIAAGKVADTPVAENGMVAVRPLMTLTLTYDHRVIDGAPAAAFLRRVKRLLENPYLLM